MQPFPVDKLLIARRNLMLPTGLTLGFVLLVFVGFIRRWKFIKHVAVGFCDIDYWRYASIFNEVDAV